MLRAAALRPALSAGAPRARVQVRFATQDYGSGDGNPAGEKPQQQGKRGREDLEHPGPPPPKGSQNKGATPSASEPSNSDNKKASSGDGNSSSSSSNSGQGVKGAQPKILNENPPDEQADSVKQHNQEMDQRAERAHEQVSNKDADKDKVPASFWSGQGGRDGEP